MSAMTASSAQISMWLAQKLSPGVSNNIAGVWEINGEIHTSVLDETYRKVLGETGSALVNFRESAEGLGVRTRGLGTWHPTFDDVSGADDPEEAAYALLVERVGAPFDLERDLLFRLGVMKLGATRHFLYVIAHHIVTDGFGVFSVARRVSDVYSALRLGKTIPAWSGGDPESMYAEEQDYRDSPATRRTHGSGGSTSWTPRTWPACRAASPWAEAVTKTPRRPFPRCSPASRPATGSGWRHRSAPSTTR
ncbi:hypothetical protein KEF29_00645 [Streptomyces tuirus]|uniref:Condensation domain-containing protein n=1 Tax=Streptomyces tuirus TaxID=68278 RepID=A0A941FE50_9ACTN|nr:hypothetical protein [Streptomyces tuirus]